MIKLGEKIREFRRRNGVTQETLALELGVTAQAVSRWEKEICCPDMELIPSIANYFGVSIDELFGYDNDRAKKVDALAARINEMNRMNDGADNCMDECIALAREALIEFPGNEKLTLALASALMNAGYVRRGEMHTVDAEGCGVYDTERHKKYPEWQEAIRLYEKLLPSLAGEARNRAADELSRLYKNTGEHEKAMLLADSAPDISGSKPLMRINAFDGKAAVAASGEALLELIRSSAGLIVQIVIADGAIAPLDAAKVLQNAAELFRLVCTESDLGRLHGDLACIQMLRSYYLWLADARDAAFETLAAALQHAKQFDGLNKNGREFYSSPLLRRVRTHSETVPENSAFASELPELWPWWDVPEKDPVLAEMQADPRWNSWLREAKQA